MSNTAGIYIFPILYLAFIAGVIIISAAWASGRARTLIGGWAAENGYQLIESERRYLRTGPYFWRHSRGQVVYYVTVIDPGGWRRSGYVRLGNWFFGMLGDQVDVTWES